MLFVTALLLAGCSSQPVVTREYLLRPALQNVAAESASTVRLSRVEVAPYLDQNGIVLIKEDDQISDARQHVWAEPLTHSIRRYLHVAIGVSAGVRIEVSPLTTTLPAAEIAVSIHQLHGSIDGTVVLVAEWTLSRTNLETQLFPYQSSRQQRSDGYASLVDAHAALLDDLAREIARHLK